MLKRIEEETDSFKRKICRAEPVRELYLEYVDKIEVLKAICHCVDIETAIEIASKELDSI